MKKTLFSGARSARASVLVIDPAVDAWSKAAPLSEARHHFGMAEAGGRLFVTGGYRLDF